LTWNDLTAAGSTGFGRSLNPGETFSVIVEFIAALDTTGLPDESTVNIASSQGITDTAEVQAFTATSVELAQREIAYENSNVILRWETADETDLVGFHIYRQLVGNENDDLMQLTADLLVAKKSGSSSGAAYVYEDETVLTPTDYRYFVGIVDTNGLEIRSLLGSVTTQRTVGEWLIYLPFLAK